MKLIDTLLNEKKYRGFFAAVNTAKHGGKKPKKISKSTWHEAKKVAGKAHESVFVFSTFLLLEAEEVPETEYGFWILGNGKVIPVGLEEHVWVLKKLGRSGSYGEAFKEGMIRVVITPDQPDTGITGAIDVEFSEDASVPALYSMARVLYHYGHEGTYITFDKNGGGMKPVDSWEFEGVQAGKRFIAKLIRDAQERPNPL